MTAEPLAWEDALGWRLVQLCSLALLVSANFEMLAPLQQSSEATLVLRTSGLLRPYAPRDTTDVET